MVDLEPYGLSDLGGDPTPIHPQRLPSAARAEEEADLVTLTILMEEPLEWKKRRRKRRRTRSLRRRIAVIVMVRTIATSKIVVNLPEFTRNNLNEFAEGFPRLSRMTGQTHASGRVKCLLLMQCCKTNYLEKQVKQITTKSKTFADVLMGLDRQ